MNKKNKKPLYKKLAMACSAALLAMTGATYAADDYQVPRTEWGQPDLQGVWNFSSNRPMERPSQFGEREFLTAQEVADIQARRAAADANSDSALPIGGVDESYNDFWVENAGIGAETLTSHIVYPKNGKIPARVDGAPVQFGHYGDRDTGEERPARVLAGGIGTDGPEDRGLSERCLVGFNAGPPFIPSLYNNNVQIFQGKDHAVLLTEMIHDARIVPIVSAEEALRPIDDDLRFWSGNSKGHWEGNTLVVTTQNFNGLTMSFGNFGTSTDKILTEKFTRIDGFTVNYEFTVDDPSTFTDKFTAIVPMTKVGGQLYEYACHEGNYGMVGILAGARAVEARE